MMLIFLVFLLTIIGGLFIFAIGTMKNANANYTWFIEAVEYSAHAANETVFIDSYTGNVTDIKLNEREARKYFEHALKEFDMNYKIKSFQTVNKGATVHKGTKAMAPGYFAEIEVKVLDAHVPLIGQQELWIPMTYYAVVQSKRI